jgi:2-haloacid dehalogenase
MMVAAHSSDLAAAAALGLRTAHVARPNEHGPSRGEAAPTVAVDVAVKNLEELAERLEDVNCAAHSRERSNLEK